jgi:hypothetical protein
MPKLWRPDHLQITPALKVFVTNRDYQGQGHIKPLHRNIAIRLVLEGGFLPEEVHPHPPLKLLTPNTLTFDQAAETTTELTILGGLKTKAVDLAVIKGDVGPVVAVSVKGTGNAFRNLTNRMEEAVGDATNIHLMYPGLVYGFFHVLKATPAGASGASPNDIAIDSSGDVVAAIRRYHDVLVALTGRRLVRDEFSRYEAVGLALVDPAVGQSGVMLKSFPVTDSPLRFDNFFDTLYKTYDLRFPYTAASVRALPRRIWSRESPAIKALGQEEQWPATLGYLPRISDA